MSDLTEKFIDYKTKYMIAKNIQDFAENLLQESAKIFGTIRISTEERKLYPLPEKAS